MMNFPQLDPDPEEEKGLYPKVSDIEKAKVNGMEPFKCYAYHKKHPGGKVFTDEVEYNMALQAGWKQAPWLVIEENKVEKAPVKVVIAPKKKAGRPKKVK